MTANQEAGKQGAAKPGAGKGRKVITTKADLEAMFGGKLGFAPDDDFDDLPEAEVIEPEDDDQF